MPAVMLSINPKWCQLIAEGKKTVECRKDIPNVMRGINPKPVKIYLYCTKARAIGWRHPKTGERMDGKVVGECFCDAVYYARKITDGLPVNYKGVLADACLTEQEMAEYGKDCNVYGWHITGVKIYDKPITISDFGMSFAPQGWAYTEDRGEWTE